MLSLFKAFETKIIVIRLPLLADQANMKEQIELHFMNRKRAGANSYESIQLRDSLIYLIYTDQADCINVLSREHKIAGHTLEVHTFCLPIF